MRLNNKAVLQSGLSSPNSELANISTKSISCLVLFCQNYDPAQSIQVLIMLAIAQGNRQINFSSMYGMAFASKRARNTHYETYYNSTYFTALSLKRCK